MAIDEGINIVDWFGLCLHVNHCFAAGVRRDSRLGLVRSR